MLEFDYLSKKVSILRAAFASIFCHYFAPQLPAAPEKMKEVPEASPPAPRFPAAIPDCDSRPGFPLRNLQSAICGLQFTTANAAP